MKHTKKLIVAVIAVVAAFALCVPALAFAAAGGTGTITVENATYGKDYTAYKIFDAEYNDADPTKISYKTDADHLEFIDDNLFEISASADSSGMYSVWAKDDASEADIIDWAKANYSKFDATGKTGTFGDDKATVLFTGMPYGYYYITSTLGSAIAIDSSNPNAKVKDKNASEPTDPVKKIVSVDGAKTGSVAEADAHVGSVVGFEITGKATNWTTTVDENGEVKSVTENKAYTFEDTFANLAINNDIVVKVNGSEITNFTADTSTEGKIVFNIPLVDADGAHLYPAQEENSAYIPVEITYTATITASAAGTPATNEIGDEIVKVYTYAFQVAKTDGSEPLPGAQFELWSNKGDAQAQAAALTFIDNGDGTYTYDANGTVTTLNMTTNTTIVVKGLDNAWTYTLKETVVPQGYNQAADTNIAGSTLTKVEEGVDTTPASKVLHKETVVNKQGSVLPSTGGMGTTILYIVGGIMIVVAAVFLVSRRRASKTDKSDDLM